MSEDTGIGRQVGFPRPLTEAETEKLATAFAEKHQVVTGLVLPHDMLMTIIADTEMVVLGQMALSTWTDTY